MISLCDISKSYLSNNGKRSVEALRHLSFEIVERGVTAVVGPSGCGKTTLLNIIAGLDTSFEGEVKFTPMRPSKVGYMFQTASLIPWRTVWDNVVVGCEIEGLAKVEYQDRAFDLLERYGLAEFGQSFPSTLSEGMQQRVSLIRLVLFGAQLFLLDEAFSRTDYLLRRELYSDLNKLIDEQNATAIIVTHDIEEAVTLGDKIVVLSVRPGRVISEIDIPVSREDRIDLPPGASGLTAPYLQRVWESLQSGEVAV